MCQTLQGVGPPTLLSKKFWGAGETVLPEQKDWEDQSLTA